MWKTASAAPRHGAAQPAVSSFDANDAWLTLVMVAQTLVCWAQALLDGDLKLAEPKTLRYRLWHVAGRIVHHARRLIVRLDRAWPWAADLVAAFARLRALAASIAWTLDRYASRADRLPVSQYRELLC
jgi:hypothetical protein